MKRNKRTLIPILIIAFVLIIALCLLFIWYTFSGNYINFGYVNNSEEDVSASEIDTSSIIVADGIVLGATKNNKWISAEKFYETNSSKSSFKVDVFSENQSYGTFETASLKRYNKMTIYTTIAKSQVPEKYLALAATENVRVMPGMTKLEPTDADKEYVKEALGSYKLINGSIKITEVYATNINQTTDRIICAISEKSNWLGVYSVVVYVTEDEASIIKYSAVRDTENSNRWPVYSLQFVMDLNEDSKPEIILRELTGDDIAYLVLELKEENKFYEVLRATVTM